MSPAVLCGGEGFLLLPLCGPAPMAEVPVTCLRELVLACSRQWTGNPLNWTGIFIDREITLPEELSESQQHTMLDHGAERGWGSVIITTVISAERSPSGFGITGTNCRQR